MERDPGDVIDRLGIARLKSIRIGEKSCWDEYYGFLSGFGELINSKPDIDWLFLLEQMIDIHKNIWDLESDIRNLRIDNDVMEVGRRAIQIREWNGKRVELKNKINSITGEGWHDIKKFHISERKS